MPWSAQIHTGFHVYGVTQDTTKSLLVFEYGTVTLFGRPFQNVLLTIVFYIVVLLPQRNKFLWFGLFRVRSPLLTESRLMSFPPGTEMFQFPGFASPRLYIHLGDTLSTSLAL